MAKRAAQKTRKQAGERSATGSLESLSDAADRLALGGLAALTVASPLIPGDGAAELGTGATLWMLWCVLLVGWLGAKAIAGQFAMHVGWLDAAVGLFFGLMGVSALAGASTGYARAGINMFWQWLSFGICFFLARQLVRSGVAMRAFASALIALAVALSALAFYQYFYSLPATRAAYERDPETVLREIGVDPADGSPERKLYEDRLYSTEPSATFALANSLAGFLTPWLVLVLGIGLAVGIRSAAAMRTLLAAVCVALCIGICLLLTKSRTAVIAVTMGAASLAVWRWRRGRGLDWRVFAAGAAALVLLVAGIVAAGARDRLVLSEAPKSVLYRLQYWESTSAMIAEHPWLGCGPGNFQQTYTRYKLPQASESISDPHNFVLEIWSTAGTPAVLVLLVILVWLAYRVLRGERSCRADNAAQDAQTNPTASETIWIFGGAAVGVPLGFVAAAAVGYPPDLAVLWIGLPVGAAAVWGLHAWTAAAAGPFAGNGEAARHADGDTAQQIGAADGALPIWVLGSALLALTINLLAAGGFSFTGVAICWWILAALILNHSDGGRRVHLTPMRAAVVAISAGLLAGACYWSMYRPVLGCHAALSDAAAARGKGLLQQAESACQRAAEIDPYSAEPWLNLAALYADLIEVTGDRDWLGDFDRAVQQAIRRRGGAATVFRRIGDWRLSLYSRLNDPLQLQHAREAYSGWVELYPSDSLAHAQLAWGRHLADDTQGAARSAEQALRLDQMHPHRERKLVNQSVFDPTGTLPASLDAEQLMKRLRR